MEHLDGRIRDTLKESFNIDELFDIQRAFVTECSRQKGRASRDLCLAAPTGSGKTLAYILPLLQDLAQMKNILPQVVALIMVPGRELAQQVVAVLEPFSAVLGFSVGLAVGQSSFSSEQKRLVAHRIGPVLVGGDSLVNILVATPGRLIDHLDYTTNFTLQHLQWLILDEADRLLDGVTQEWIQPLFKSLSPSVAVRSTDDTSLISVRNSSVAPFHCPLWVTPLRKILCSATLTRNPAKLAQLRLTDPIYINSTGKVVSGGSAGTERVEAKYLMPKELQEYMYVTEEDRKPIALIHLLRDENITSVLCFTKSVDAAERLTRLLRSIFPDKRIHAFSSERNTKERAELLLQFNAAQIDLLICSDAAARGLDLAEVSVVINYDVPKFAKAYVHRVGRTARAGKSGKAYTILAIKEAHHFREILGKTGRNKLPSLKIPKHLLADLLDTLNVAIEKLK